MYVTIVITGCIVLAIVVAVLRRRSRKKAHREALRQQFMERRFEQLDLVDALREGRTRKVRRELKKRGCEDVKGTLEAIQSLIDDGSLDHLHAIEMDAVDAMDGREFEKFAAAVLVKCGFTNVELTPGSGDQGVDILAVLDRESYAIQCKHYGRPLGSKPVQEVTAGKAVWGCDYGVVLTNSRFNRAAQEAAEATETLLWDRRDLMQLMMRAGLKRMTPEELEDARATRATAEPLPPPPAEGEPPQ